MRCTGIQSIDCVRLLITPSFRLSAMGNVMVGSVTLYVVGEYEIHLREYRDNEGIEKVRKP